MFRGTTHARDADDHRASTVSPVSIAGSATTISGAIATPLDIGMRTGPTIRPSAPATRLAPEVSA